MKYYNIVTYSIINHRQNIIAERNLVCSHFMGKHVIQLDKNASQTAEKLKLFLLTFENVIVLYLGYFTVIYLLFSTFFSSLLK